MAQRIAVDAYKAKVSFVARRCAFMKDKVMVMNMAVNKALEYVATFVQLEGKYIQEMRKWAREKLAWQGRKKVIGAGGQIFAEKEMGGLGVKDPGLVCEEAGINTFLRSALEKEGTVCSRIVEQRIRDNKRLEKMGCDAGDKDTRCPRCGRSKEDQFHVFVKCPWNLRRIG